MGSIYGTLILIADATDVYQLVYSDTREIGFPISRGQQSNLLKYEIINKL